jgi:hypothetical protein
MSDRQKGAQRVRSVEDRLHALGYRTAIVSSSGQRRGARHESLALDGDLVAIAPAGSPWPHLVCEVGGKSKGVAASLREMTEPPLPPGFVAVVARLVDSRTRKPGAGWRYSAEGNVVADDLRELLGVISSA